MDVEVICFKNVIRGIWFICVLYKLLIKCVVLGFVELKIVLIFLVNFVFVVVVSVLIFL